MGQKHHRKDSGIQSPLVSRRKVIGSVAALSAAAVLPAFAGSRHENHNMSEGKFPALMPQSLYAISRPGISRQFTTFDPQTKVKGVRQKSNLCSSDKGLDIRQPHALDECP